MFLGLPNKFTKYAKKQSFNICTGLELRLQKI